MSANRLKSNAGKTELLWAGLKYSQSSLGSKGLPLQIDSDTVPASDHVRVIGVTFSTRSQPGQTVMFLSYVHHVSSGYVSFDEFDYHWTMSP